MIGTVLARASASAPVAVGEPGLSSAHVGVRGPHRRRGERGGPHRARERDQPSSTCRRPATATAGGSSCFLRDDDGALVAGIAGFTWGGYAQIDFLWVTTEHRAQGLGRRLVEAAEAEAEARGCRTIVVSSHSFQAPAMYRHLGYAEIGAADDAPIGARHFYFQKVL